MKKTTTVLSALLFLAGCGGGTEGENPTFEPPPGILYDVGVVVSGLEGTSIVLQNNGRDDLSVTQDGLSHFTTKLPAGSMYAVTILTPPVGRTCSVTNASGTIQDADITNISVDCVANG